MKKDLENYDDDDKEDFSFWALYAFIFAFVAVLIFYIGRESRPKSMTKVEIEMREKIIKDVCIPWRDNAGN